ncbi:MAG: hypothetical protein ISR90_06970 [Candidatus Marinimicrobia bacterium]|nr:hypothetical protein [Candidatus Neomarinimicrobiota bacterium]MBL7023773.1 hypothetical protein [Candidatus Neomarinimicrobiota bacterium]MBL7110098.1 hypothetical protein [Candidatus Neomarinimicrobiota bacterium]
MDDFTLIALTDDFDMSTRLARISNSINCELVFAENNDIVEICEKTSGGVVIIDLNTKSYNSFDIAKNIRDYSTLIICGFVEKINKDVRRKAEKYGFDLVFPKSMFTQNLKFIIGQSKIEG